MSTPGQDPTLDIKIRASVDPSLPAATAATTKQLQAVAAASAAAAAPAAEQAKQTGLVTDEMKAQAQAAVDQINANERSAAAAKDAAEKTGSMRQSLYGLKEILSGTINGNMREVANGFIRIGQASQVANSPVAALISGLGRGAAIGGTFAAPAIVGLLYLRNEAARTRAAISKIFTDHDRETADLKAGYDGIEKAAKVSLDAQLAEVEKLSAGFSDLTSRMDAAQARAKDLFEATNKLSGARIDRDEQAALATAKTPEQRAAIAAAAEAKRTALADNSAKLGLENQASQASVVKTNAEAAKSDAQRAIDAAEADAREKRQAADDAISISGQALRDNGPGSANARRAITAAQAAKKEADLADENLTAVRGKSGAIIDTANKQIETADNTAALVKIQLQALEYAKQAAAQKDVTALQPKIADLKARAQTAEEAGNFSEQDKAVAELRAVNAQLAASQARMHETIVTSAKAQTRANNDTSDRVDITIRALKNSRSSP